MTRNDLVQRAVTRTREVADLLESVEPNVDLAQRLATSYHHLARIAMASDLPDDAHTDLEQALDNLDAAFRRVKGGYEAVARQMIAAAEMRLDTASLLIDNAHAARLAEALH